MSQRIIECVPNFSEGRDKAVIRQITAAIEASGGVKLLDVDPGEATNRTVVTFVGEPEAVVEAAFAGVKRAAELIDMRRHKGAHPRMASRLRSAPNWRARWPGVSPTNCAFRPIATRPRPLRPNGKTSPCAAPGSTRPCPRNWRTRHPRPISGRVPSTRGLPAREPRPSGRATS